MYKGVQDVVRPDISIKTCSGDWARVAALNTYWHLAISIAVESELKVGNAAMSSAFETYNDFTVYNGKLTWSDFDI